MHKGLLTGVGVFLAVAGLAQLAVAVEDRISFAAQANEPDLFAGCGDIPEAIILMEEYVQREAQIERYLALIDQREADIRGAEKSLSATLARLKSQRSGTQISKADKEDKVAADVKKMVAVFDQMKASEAAEVLTNLPADFASEIVIRLRPENGAKIIAALEPRQAAILTTHMGARNLTQK